jgi:hypothetical protein
MSGKFSVAEAAHHIREITTREKLDVILVRPDRARAWRGARRLAIPEIRSARSYFVALHELGHILGPNPALRLDQEVSAWRWALSEARQEPTPACWAMVGRALGSYIARAVDRAGMRVPEEAHPIWTLVPVDHAEVLAFEAEGPTRRRAALAVIALVRQRLREATWVA